MSESGSPPEPRSTSPSTLRSSLRSSSRSTSLSGAQLLALLTEAGLSAPEQPGLAATALPERVAGVADDSRNVVAGGVFVAIRGHDADGHQYVASAVDRGATVVVAESPIAWAGAPVVPVILVRDSRAAAARIAAEFHGRPADSLRLVGITGTNGKTTTAHMVRALLTDCGVPAASIGTLGVCVGHAGEPLPSGTGLTTPGPVALQRTLRQLVDLGIRAVVMEVSSHALDQRRVEGLTFAAVVFTSFSRDHLDYHGTMEAYFAAKASLVGFLAANGTAVVNGDEPAWKQLPATPRTIRFGTSRDTSPDTNHDASGRARLAPGMLQAEAATFLATGSRFTLRACDEAGAETVVAATLPLLGDFNVTNALGAVAAAWALGVSLEALCASLARMPQVPGRLERLVAHPTVLRDYAHTPDALERALRAVRPFARTAEGLAARVHVVFGCGGDRDRGKRPQMAAIAERLADVFIMTSDNPRTEDPERILDDMEHGLAAPLRDPNRRIEDRRAAIAHALATAGPDDVVLLAGKGHETYQLRGTERLDFDEAAIVATLRSTSDGAPS